MASTVRNQITRMARATNFADLPMLLALHGAGKNKGEHPVKTLNRFQSMVPDVQRTMYKPAGYHAVLKSLQGWGFPPMLESIPYPTLRAA